MTTDYATVSIDDVEIGETGDSTGERSFTDRLGCSATTVDGYRSSAGGTISLSAAPEHVVIPLTADGPVPIDGGVELPPRGIARVPAGVSSTLRCSTATSVVVIGAPVESNSGGTPTAIAFDDCEFEATQTSTIKTARLTARLGCRGMKINARILTPGVRVPYHTEGQQEELFIPVRGQGTMRIDGESRKTPVGTITRVAPPVPRSAINDGDTKSLWVMVGAPPTGGATEWAPGVEIVE